MNYFIRFALLILAVLMLNACAAYRDAINILAPDKQTESALIPDQDSVPDMVNTNAYCMVQPQLGVVTTGVATPSTTYTLFFELGQDTLTRESQAKADAIYKAVVNTHPGLIFITGHTDTLGSHQYNDRLSLKRAAKIKRSLLAAGARPSSIKSYSAGESALPFKTPDNTAEPKNRCVYISVR